MHDDRVVQQPVQQGCGDHGVPKNLTPFGKAAVGGQNHCPTLISGVDQLEKQVPRGGAEGQVADLVDDQQLGAAEIANALAQSPLPGLPGGTDRVLVVINFQGGNDGLNTVVPFGMPDYYRYRPSLGVTPNEVLRIDDTFGLNPVLAPFKKMYDSGNVAIVHGVGYDQPSFSHFSSMAYWQTGAPNSGGVRPRLR